MWRGPYLDPIHRLLYLGSTGAVEQIINTNPSVLGRGRQFVQGLRGAGGFSQPSPHCPAATPSPTPTCHEKEPFRSESGQY